MLPNHRRSWLAAVCAAATILTSATSSYAQYKKYGAVFEGKLGPTTNRGGKVYLMDLYQKDSLFFEVKYLIKPGDLGETFVFGARARGFDPILRLESPDGAVLQTNDDYAPPNRDARITFNPTKAGRYRLVVSSYDAKREGKVSVSVNRLVKRAATPTKVQMFVGNAVIPKGQTVKNKDGSITGFFKWQKYQFKLKGRPNGIYAYTIEAAGYGFSPAFTVADAKGKIVAQGKASGKNRRRIVFVPPSQGTYTITVLNNDNGTQGGRFGLRIFEEVTR